MIAAVALIFVALVVAAVGAIAGMDPNGRGGKVLLACWAAAILCVIAAVVVGIRSW